MTTFLARAMLALAAATMGERHEGWARAMAGEVAAAAAEGKALSFAFGCLIAAWRAALTSSHGRFLLTSYAVAIGILLPMAALQIACVGFGLSYLYPGDHGLAGALLDGMATKWLWPFYQSAGPVLALLQLAIGIGHVRLAWVMLERDWTRALRWSARTLAASTTLIVFMGALFLNVRQSLIMGAVVGVELAILLIVSSWHADLSREVERTA